MRVVQGSGSELITQARIDSYARASGDFNPLHVDPAFGRTTPFGSTIAHGPLSTAFAARLFRVRFPDRRLMRLSVKYIGPVRSGDEVSCDAQPDPRGEDLASGEVAYEFSCRNQRGEAVTVGRAVLAPR